MHKISRKGGNSKKVRKVRVWIGHSDIQNLTNGTSIVRTGTR
jgi:hypothetical protein